MKPESTTEHTPIKYAEGPTHHALPKIADDRSAIIGIFAPHGINVVVIMVIRRSRSFSIVLDAIIPGTPQPDATRSGIKDFPESPNFLNTRSSTKATRDI